MEKKFRLSGVSSVYNGTDATPFLGHKIWEIVPQNILEKELFSYLQKKNQYAESRKIFVETTQIYVRKFIEHP